MASQTVSFRFLQAVTNAVTGDHVTVGVLQWDGARLRFAGESRKVTAEQGRSTLRRALSAIRGQLPRQAVGQTSLFEAIRDAFPVPEGDGSLLRWGDVRRGSPLILNDTSKIWFSWQSWRMRRASRTWGSVRLARYLRPSASVCS